MVLEHIFLGVLRTSIPFRFRSPVAQQVFGAARKLGDSPMATSQILPSEEALVAWARTGNLYAFGELVRRHRNAVYGMSFKILKNREDAEDSLQNAFFKAYRRIRQFEGKSLFSTWLTRIAINEALMILRKRQKGDAVEISGVEVNDENYGKNEHRNSLLADLERQYLAKEIVAKAINALNPEIRSTFILHKVQGRTGQEAAKVLNVSAETVKSRVFRARVRMQRRILDLTGSTRSHF
jgi:RNA polymerase sigma-70 factor (ECF subfamily)